jgi:DNA helicase TIP49 (TBP-interacting protein)
MGSYIPTPDELSRLLLFFKNIKAETDAILRQDLRELFVTTDEFYEAQIEGKAIILGRKGSGKTALLLGFSHYYDDDYLDIVGIDADEIPITSLYNYYLADHLKRSVEVRKQAEGIASERDLTELTRFINPVRLSTYAWEKAFQNYGLYLGCKNLISFKSCGTELTGCL